MFHSFCDRGEAENALNIFDREQLLAFGTETTEASEEIWAEYPRIVAVSLTKKRRMFHVILMCVCIS